VEQKRYIIRGGQEGRARLQVLSRVMQPTTLNLLNRAGLRSGMHCLEVGCGSGDVAFDLARMVGPDGRVVATDIADAVMAEGLASHAEVDRLVHELYEFACATGHRY
jgi:ubiquinone/menaquinone biosynthesis C-methylase UbiE